MNNAFSSFANKSLPIKLGIILCLFLFGLFSGATCIALFSNWYFLQSHTYINQVMMLAISSLATFLLPAWLWTIINGKNTKSFLKINIPQRPSFFLWAFLLVFVALPFVQYTAFVNQQIPMPSLFVELEKKANEQLQNLLQLRTPLAITINLLLIGILPAIVEELFFRSVLQKTIYEATKKVWLSIVITACIFSFLHFQFLGFFPRVVLGILLGILFQYSNSILPSMLFHAIFNSFQLILYYSFNIDLDKVNSQDINSWSLLGVATISFAAVYFIVKKKILPQY